MVANWLYLHSICFQMKYYFCFFLFDISITTCQMNSGMQTEKMYFIVKEIHDQLIFPLVIKRGLGASIFMAGGRR